MKSTGFELEALLIGIVAPLGPRKEPSGIAKSPVNLPIPLWMSAPGIKGERRMGLSLGRHKGATKLDNEIMYLPKNNGGEDGRYIVIRGRLWRASDPGLDEAERQRLVSELMVARRDVGRSKNDPAAMKAVRKRVHEAKVCARDAVSLFFGNSESQIQ